MHSLWILSLSFSLAGAICHHGTSLYKRHGDIKKPTFGYTNAGGPLEWHGLSENNTICAEGQNQSPISITSESSTPVNGSTLQFNITGFPQGATLLNLGTTLEVEANGTMSLDNTAYRLRQFHFHTPSEHRFEDEFYPMEIHFVFQAADESLAVVGTFVEIAGARETPSAFISSVFSNIHTAREFGSAVPTAALDFTALEEHISNSTVWQYDGSLTTPTCNEGVAWNVVQRPLFVSPLVFRHIKSVMKFNSRYTQNVPGGVNLLSDACAGIIKEEIKQLLQ